MQAKCKSNYFFFLTPNSILLVAFIFHAVYYLRFTVNVDRHPSTSRVVCVLSACLEREKYHITVRGSIGVVNNEEEKVYVKAENSLRSK